MLPRTLTPFTARLVILLLFLLLLVAIRILALIILLTILLILVVIIVEVHDCVLFVLIFGDEIAHIFVGLLELHFVHPFAFVPMQKRLPPIHFGELRADALKHAFDRRGIRHERAAHRRAFGRHTDNARFDIIRDPRNKVPM